MTTKRMISSDIWRDEFIRSLDYFERILWIGLLVTCADDQGRIYDDEIIVTDIFPTDRGVDYAKVSQALDKFEQSGKIVRYKSAERAIVQITNWWKYQSPQWVSPSKYPPPPNWTDRYRYHTKGNKIVTLNWDMEGGYQNKTINDASPLPSKLPSPLPSKLGYPIEDVYGDGNDDGSGGGGGYLPPLPQNNIIKIYESEIGPITPIVADELTTAEKDYPPEWIADALKEASLNNKRSWKYALAILKRWKAEGRGSRNGKTKESVPVLITLPDGTTTEART